MDFALGHATTVGVAERGGVLYGEPRFGRTKRPEGLKAAVGSDLYQMIIRLFHQELKVLRGRHSVQLYCNMVGLS